MLLSAGSKAGAGATAGSCASSHTTASAWGGKQAPLGAVSTGQLMSIGQWEQMGFLTTPNKNPAARGK